jgi:hypothetical protein
MLNLRAAAILCLIVLMIPFHVLARADCEDGHWIDSVTDDGSIIKLEDGSIWEVMDGDTIDSQLWLPTSNIMICGNKLINTDDSEAVSAVRIK